MKQVKLTTRKGLALRRATLAAGLLALLWVLPTYHITPGQATRAAVRDQMLEGPAEILATRYFRSEKKLCVLQLAAAGDDTVLTVSRFHPLVGWNLTFAMPAEAAEGADFGYYGDSRSDPFTAVVFGRVRDRDVDSVLISVNWQEDAPPKFRLCTTEKDWIATDRGTYFWTFLPEHMTNHYRLQLWARARPREDNSLDPGHYVGALFNQSALDPHS